MLDCYPDPRNALTPVSRIYSVLSALDLPVIALVDPRITPEQREQIKEAGPLLKKLKRNGFAYFRSGLEATLIGYAPSLAKSMGIEFTDDYAALRKGKNSTHSRPQSLAEARAVLWLDDTGINPHKLDQEHNHLVNPPRITAFLDDKAIMADTFEYAGLERFRPKSWNLSVGDAQEDLLAKEGAYPIKVASSPDLK